MIKISFMHTIYLDSDKYISSITRTANKIHSRPEDLLRFEDHHSYLLLFHILTNNRSHT